MRSALAVFAVVLCAACSQAQSPSFRDAQRAEVRLLIDSLLRTESAAFAAGDCDAALVVYGDRSPLFVVSGNTMSDRDALVSACPRLVAARPPGASREIVDEVIHVISEDAAYSVTEFALPVRENGEMRGTVPQLVTKIWSRQSGEWRIVHVHESVADGGGR